MPAGAHYSARGTSLALSSMLLSGGRIRRPSIGCCRRQSTGREPALQRAPLALATKFPRAANRIAQEWREPSACRRDFDDLVYDKRGTRRGFPPDVYVELLALRDYYYGYDLKLANEA